MQQLIQDLRYAVRGLTQATGLYVYRRDDPGPWHRCKQCDLQRGQWRPAPFPAIAGLTVALRRAHGRRHFQPL